MIDVYGILVGAGTGALIAALGYAKTIHLDEVNGTSLTFEKFDAFKFLFTIVIGAIAGAVAQYANLSYDIASQAIASAGITTLVEYAIKFVWRTFEGAFQRDWLKKQLKGLAQ